VDQYSSRAVIAVGDIFGFRLIVTFRDSIDMSLLDQLVLLRIEECIHRRGESIDEESFQFAEGWFLGLDGWLQLLNAKGLAGRFWSKMLVMGIDQRWVYCGKVRYIYLV
jgi:hypothetical protein